VEFMSSDGGLLPLKSFSGLKSILSGPAGGVVGYALTSWEEGGRPVIGYVYEILYPTHQRGRSGFLFFFRRCVSDYSGYQDRRGRYVD
jgi:hypothetical protein